jgi:glycosyltransferase involved in cell wall biosynthesis
MKILVLCPRMPRVDGKADSMTVYRLARHFAARHHLCLLTFEESDEDLKAAELLRRIGVDVRTVPLRRFESFWQMLRTGLSAIPLQAAYYTSRAMDHEVREAVQQFQPDLVYAHLIRMAPYALDIKGVRRVLAMQISQTLNYQRMVAHVRSPFHRMLYGVELSKVRRYEPLMLRRFDSCLLISPHDLKAIDGSDNHPNVFFSPHGVDTEYYRRRTDVNRDATTMLFCGVLETPTNSDAVHYFAEQIYPRIRSQVPTSRYRVVGRNPPASVQALARTDPSIEVVGSVPDVRPYYSEAAIGVAPIRIGAGMQNKLLVGMCLEQAMVVTSVANEGIGGTPGVHLLVADTPAEFADAVVSLARDPSKAAEMGRKAREFVEQGWSWEYWFDQLERHLESLVDKQAGPVR